MADFLALSANETQGAGQVGGHVQTDQNPVIHYDALATASLINSALEWTGETANDVENIGSEPGRSIVKHMKAMKNLSSQLSYNTLVPWLQGACLLVGDLDDWKLVFGTRESSGGSIIYKANPFVDKGWRNDEQTEWLRELRRQNGNTWDAAMAAARFLETKKLSVMREDYWANLPASTSADKIAGVRGYKQTG